MSLFTTSLAAMDQPICPRCNKTQGVILVRKAEGHNVWECKLCPKPVPIQQGQSAQRGRKAS